jgi:uncharacterized protein YeaO (DUF488 family)
MRGDGSIRVRSVGAPIQKDDGLRILVSRFRGRGLSRRQYDLWMPNLGPSEKLLRQFQSGAITWREFGRRYQHELFESTAFDRDNKTIKNRGQKFTLRLLQLIASRQRITLMCHCAEAEPHCHRHLLRRILDRKI